MAGEYQAILSLQIGNLLLGCGNGFSAVTVPAIKEEMSSVKTRGGFLSLYGLMQSLGVLAIYCLGAPLYWRYVSSVPAVLYLLLLLSLSRIPESPLWLLTHRGTEQCREALMWLRGTEDVTDEICRIQEVKEQQSHGLTMTEAFRNLSRPDIRTPFILINVNMYLVAFSGPMVIIYNSVEIFQQAGVSIDRYLASIIAAAISVLGGIIGVFLIQRLPRVRLAMVSMTLMSVSMIVLGVALYLKTEEDYSPVLDVVPVISVTLYMFSFGAGVSPLSFVFLGELLPTEYKVLAGVIVFLLNGGMFIVIQIFPTLLALLTPPGTYWMFSAVSLSSNIFYYFWMPETRGKSELEIKQMFLKNELKYTPVAM